MEWEFYWENEPLFFLFLLHFSLNSKLKTKSPIPNARFSLSTNPNSSPNHYRNSNFQSLCNGGSSNSTIQIVNLIDSLHQPWRRFWNSSSSRLTAASLRVPRWALERALSSTSVAGKPLCGCFSLGIPAGDPLAAVPCPTRRETTRIWRGATRWRTCSSRRRRTTETTARLRRRRRRRRRARTWFRFARRRKMVRLDRPVGNRVLPDRLGPVSDTSTCSGKRGGRCSPASPSNGWLFFLIPF